MSCEYDQTGVQEIREEAIWDADNIERLPYEAQSEPMYGRDFC